MAHAGSTGREERVDSPPVLAVNGSANPSEALAPCVSEEFQAMESTLNRLVQLCRSVGGKVSSRMNSSSIDRQLLPFVFQGQPNVALFNQNVVGS